MGAIENMQAEIDKVYQEVISERRVTGTEADIVNMFRMCMSAESAPLDDRIPLSRLDSVVYEMAFKFGRADIVAFHVDGSASVIEVKDGTKGYNHVVAGLGQAGLYAAQLAMNRGTLTKVRKCLLWTSTGNVALDAVIEEMCEQANAVPLPWAKLSVHLGHREAVRRVYGKA
jgi:hypothetical protein